MDIKNTLILAIGTGAQNIVNCFYEQNKDFNILCIDNDKETLNKSNTKTLCFEDVTSKYIREQILEKKIKPHKRLNQNQVALLRKELADYKNAVIVSALGGSFSTYMTSAFIELVTLLNISYKVVITFPFSFEGKNRTFASQQALNELKVAGCIVRNNLFIYENDTLLYGNDKEITDISELFAELKQMKKISSIQEAFKEIDKEVTKIITMILN